VGVEAVAVGVLLGAGGEGLEVHARTEVAACAGEDGNAQLVVVLELLPRVVHHHEHLGREGVLSLRTIHGEGEDVAVAFDKQVCHGATLLTCIRWSPCPQKRSRRRRRSSKTGGSSASTAASRAS